MNYIEVKVEVEKCEWSRESDDVWRSDCGLLWEFDNEETPKANNMNYCPQCGKILEEAPECWEEDAYDVAMAIGARPVFVEEDEG